MVRNETFEEIGSLDLDILTTLARLYQARDLIVQIDSMAERLITCDAPRLARHLTEESVEWLERTDLDTGLVEWIAELRTVDRQGLPSAGPKTVVAQRPLS